MIRILRRKRDRRGVMPFVPVDAALENDDGGRCELSVHHPALVAGNGRGRKSGQFGEGSIGAVGGHRAADEIGVGGCKPFRTEIEPSQARGDEVVDHHVGTADQLQERRTGFRVVQVGLHARLVLVDVPVGGGEDRVWIAVRRFQA